MTDAFNVAITPVDINDSPSEASSNESDTSQGGKLDEVLGRNTASDGDSDSDDAQDNAARVRNTQSVYAYRTPSPSSCLRVYRTPSPS